MVEAARSLSPKRAAERLRRLRSAIRTMMIFNAKKVVKEQIRARGDKVGHYSSKSLVLLAEDYIAKNLEEMINQATADVVTWPEFRALIEERKHDGRGNQPGRLQDNPGANCSQAHTQLPVAKQ